MTYTIPIIILNWNGRRVLKPCFDSIEKQSYGNHQIHLVDNGSETEDKAFCANYAAQNSKVVYYDLPENLGFAPACNMVLEKLIKQGEFKFVALLNNDTEVSENWLEEMLQTAEEHQLDMVSSKQVFYANPKKIDNLGLTLISTSEIMPVAARELAEQHTAFKPNLCPSAGAGLYRLEIFEKAGYFNTYFKTCYEDAELGLRAALLGYKSGIAINAVVKHRVSYSVNKAKTADYGTILQKNMLFTYFSLMPLSIVAVKLPLIVFKTLAISLLALLTFRFKLLKSQMGGLGVVVFRFSELVKRRKQVKHKLSFVQVLKLHKSFLGFYIKYFKNFIVSSKPTVLE